MSIIMLIVIAVLGVISSTSAQQEDEDICIAMQQLPTKSEIIVAYYGRPDVASLGVPGQFPIEELIQKIKTKADKYAIVSGNQNVTPAFDIIDGLAGFSVVGLLATIVLVYVKKDKNT